jgi:DNA (cytosine-5)-methyltransferase 1
VDRHLRSDGNEVPRTDLIVGGFPCQDYSVARTLNSAKGLEGKKGVLWWDIHKLIEANKPHYVFLENVDRLLKSPSSQKGRDFAVMLKTLGSLDYHIEWRVSNAADYGFPQRRKRVFIIATKLSSNLVREFDALKCIQAGGVLARALPIKRLANSLEEIKLEGSPDMISESFGKFGGRSPFDSAGVFLDGVAYTTPIEARHPKRNMVLGDVLQADPVEESFWVDQNRVKDWESLKGAKKIVREHKGSGEPYVYAEGAMAFPDSLAKPSRTVLTGEGGSSPSRFKHVVEIDGRLRRLTPIELERLNGFPDDWTLRTDSRNLSNSTRAFFMGNALIIGQVAKIGKVLASDFVKRPFKVD